MLARLAVSLGRLPKAKWDVAGSFGFTAQFSKFEQ